MTVKNMQCVDDTPTLVGEPMYIHKGQVYQVEFEDSHPYDGIVKVLDPDSEEDLRLVNMERIGAIRWPELSFGDQQDQVAAVMLATAHPLPRGLTKEQIAADPTIFHRHSPRYAASRFIEV